MRRTVVSSRRALTLIEMLVSLAILGVILGAVGSVMVLSAKALPSGSEPTAVSSSARDSLRGLVAEAELATSFTTATARVMVFTLADRDANGSAETVRYEWSGTAGDPLTRVYNSGRTDTVIPGVQSLTFTYETEADTVDAGTTSATSPEVCFFTNTTGTTGESSFDLNTWVGQIFTPLLPTNATAWKLTRFRYSIAADGTKSGTTQIQIRPVSTSTYQPSAVNHLSTTKLESAIPGSSYLWYSVDASSVPQQPRGGALVIVMGNTGLTSSGKVRVMRSGYAQSGCWLIDKLPAVSLWTATTDGAMQLEIFGTYTYPVTTTSAVQRVKSITAAVTLVSGGTTLREVIAPRAKPIGSGL